MTTGTASNTASTDPLSGYVPVVAEYWRIVLEPLTNTPQNQHNSSVKAMSQAAQQMEINVELGSLGHFERHE